MTVSYRPSNGDEGCAFMSRWCERCCHDGDVDAGEGCDIIAYSMACDSSDPDYPKEWVMDEGHRMLDDPLGPRCTAFQAGEAYVDLKKARADRERYDALPRDPATGRPVI